MTNVPLSSLAVQVVIAVFFDHDRTVWCVNGGWRVVRCWCFCKKHTHTLNSVLKVMPGQKNACLYSFTPEAVAHCLLKQWGGGVCNMFWWEHLVLDVNSFNYINSKHTHTKCCSYSLQPSRRPNIPDILVLLKMNRKKKTSGSSQNKTSKVFWFVQHCLESTDLSNQCFLEEGAAMCCQLKRPLIREAV